MYTPTGTELVSFASRGVELLPDTTTYLLRADRTVFLIDPGPDWHVETHLPSIRDRIEPGDELVAVIASALPGCLSGLRHLTSLTRSRAVWLHWVASATGEGLLRGWTIEPFGDADRSRATATTARLSLVSPTGSGVPGALLAHDSTTGTLFTGALFGSIGHGRTTSVPILRRESVRAYTDLFTPMLDRRSLFAAIGDELPITRIGPAHGRPASGGRRLIESVFTFDRDEPTIAWAFHRLYLRIAGLLGPETANSVFGAAGVARPDLEHGYAADTSVGDRFARDPGSEWIALYESMGKWLSVEAMLAIDSVVARVALAVGLPVPLKLQRAANALRAERAARVREFGAVDRPAPAARERTSRAGGSVPGQDQVTGLPDEQAFQAVSTEYEADRSRLVALLLIGVDGLQRINASYGRVGGDDALYAVSYLLRNHQAADPAGVSHRLYKLSGPVFAYVMRDASLAAATTAAERIRQSVAESAMFVEQVTVSIGVVAVDDPATGAVDDPAGGDWTLHRIAQARLVHARRSGTNTVCSVDPEGASRIDASANVLIIDPDAPYLEILTRQLEAKGFAVLTAHDGEEALAAIAQIAPDVIVCEAMLPKANGFEVRERLRHSSRVSDIPFVLISHRKSEELIEKAGLVGITHFLRKPISLTELTGLLRNLAFRGAST